MIGHTNPQVLRVVEQTIANLKQLETCIDTLRLDLAGVAESIGHPEAAQRALAPARAIQSQLPAAALGQIPFAPGAMQSPWGASSFAGNVNPYAAPQNPALAQSPLALSSPYANQAAISSLYGQSPLALSSPYANQAAISNLYGQSPLALSSPYANPWASQTSFAATSPYASVSPFAAQSAVSPFAQTSPFSPAFGSGIQSPFARF